MIDNTTIFHADGVGLETATWEVGEPGQWNRKGTEERLESLNKHRPMSWTSLGKSALYRIELAELLKQKWQELLMSSGSSHHWRSLSMAAKEPQIQPNQESLDPVCSTLTAVQLHSICWPGLINISGGSAVCSAACSTRSIQKLPKSYLSTSLVPAVQASTSKIF